MFQWCLSHNLRGHSMKQRTKVSRLKLQCEPFTQREVEKWDDLLQSVLNAGSLQLFKKRLDEVLSEVLCILEASGTTDSPTFAEHFNKLKPYTFDDASSGPISTYAPAFPSEELSSYPLPSPPVENSHPMPSSAVASSPLIKRPLPRDSQHFRIAYSAAFPMDCLNSRVNVALPSRQVTLLFFHILTGYFIAYLMSLLPLHWS
nr:unnamed protein product [Spirometra erinaceieuropaei]